MTMTISSRLFAVCSAILILLTGCTTLQEFVSPASVYKENNPLTYEPSIISINIGLPINKIENSINEQTQDGVPFNGTVEFKETYRAKTDNPLYNPKKWLKTKNPAYSPNKMIKKCISGLGFKDCWKTKNPFYNPKKWLKTKNPAYTPNRYLYADAITVDVDADWEVTVSRNDKFEVHTSKDNKNAVRFILPIEVDGSVGFRGDGAKLLALNKKNIRGKVDIVIDLDMAIKPNWCPEVSVYLDYKWRKGSGIELIGGQWLDLSRFINLGNIITKPVIINAVKSHFNCDTFKRGLEEATKPSAIAVAAFVEDKLGNLPEDASDDDRIEATLNDGLRKMYFNYHIQEVSTTGTITDGENIGLDLSIKANTYFDTKPLIADGNGYPDLTIKPRPDVNFLGATLPLVAQYEVMNGFLNTKKNIQTLNKSLLKNEAIQINEFEVFPKEESLAVRVNVTVKSEKSVLSAIINKLPFIRDLFDTTGDIYLSATPYMTDKNIVKLKDVQYVVDADNELYNLVGNTSEFILSNYVQGLGLFDFDKEIEKLKGEIPNLIQKMLKDKKFISLELVDTIIEPNADVIIGSGDVMYILSVKTGFDLELIL
jgi:hypothetical protein